MSQEDFKRKLTAILSADVVGYSRLMGEEEEGTVRTLNKYKELIFNLIDGNNGRVIDSPGDNVLTEFASVVDAVRCGVQIQEDLKARNEERPTDNRMEFRIGIHTGDVIQDGQRIYGDGVNVAARIESLADSGGICISRTAYDQVKGKIDIDYEYLGEYEVKNIKEPVRVYKIQKEKYEVKITTGNKTSSISEKPSIAVLPFLNLSSDPEQEYFVDGLSEEILNSLAQISDLTVIARTSSFSFKGTNKKIQEIARELEVNHILEGSVRKAGNAIRITAQLIKTVDGSHLWSKTYDRELKVEEIFSIQENIAISVADELKVKLGIGKSFKQIGGTDNMEAYELYLVARGLLLSKVAVIDFNYIYRALEVINSIILLDPEYALAWALKGYAHTSLAWISSVDRSLLEFDAALEAALKAIELEANLGEAYFSMGSVYTWKNNFIEAEKNYRKGIQLKTDSIDCFQYDLTGHYLNVGYLKKSFELMKEMRRNDPLSPELRGYYISHLNLIGEFDLAEEEYERGKKIFGDQWETGALFISFTRLVTKGVLSINDLPDPVRSYPIYYVLIENIDSPNDGLDELQRLYSNKKDLDSLSYSMIAGFAAYFGDPEFALAAMERSRNIWVIWSPLMKEVRKLPRFKKYIREIGLVDYWKEYGWPDLCHPVGDDDFVCD